MATQNLNAIVEAAIGLAAPFIPMLGDGAHSLTERAVTIPHARIEQLCHSRGITDPAKIELAYKSFQQMADGLSDGVVFIASGGQIEPD